MPGGTKGSDPGSRWRAPHSGLLPLVAAEATRRRGSWAPGGAAPEPVEVGIVAVRPSMEPGSEGAGVPPLVAVGVSVGEDEDGGALVIGTGSVPQGGPLHGDDEGGKADALRLHIREEEAIRGVGDIELGPLPEGAESGRHGVESHDPCVTDVGVHGIAAHPLPLVEAVGRPVGRASVEIGEVQVAGEGGMGAGEQFRTADGPAEMVAAGDPPAAVGAPLPRPVLRQPALVVVGIEGPDQVELPLIVHAGRLQGPAPGPGEGRKEQPGKDGDDGDHHQQFDEGETPACRDPPPGGAACVSEAHEVQFTAGSVPMPRD